MDCGTAIGVADMVCSAAKALYLYTKAWKGYEKDAALIQEHLNWLYDLFKSAESALRLDLISEGNRSLLQDALLRCRKYALELSNTADRVRPLGSEGDGSTTAVKRRAQRFLYPFRKSTIKDLLDQIRSCQNQLNFALDFLQMDYAKLAQVALEESNAKLGIIEETLRSAEERSKAQRIANSLHDGLSEKRRLAVEDAHADTFRWIFYDHISSFIESKDKSSTKTGERRDSEDADLSLNDSRFASWLKEDSDVFWIRGKAGSGKSTLMKFLIDSQTTRRLLKQWAGSQSLILAEHFFWISGSVQQKTKHGMLQNLLHQLLNANLQLVPKVCQSRWQSDVNEQTSWSTSGLTKSLHVVAQIPAVRICLFIDGLDECDPESEHLGLVSDIFKLASHKNVKIVVSSRPWPIFDCSLARKDTIVALEDLTRKDMLEYVRDKLTSYSRGQIPKNMRWSYAHFTRDQVNATFTNGAERQVKQLVLEVLNKANGVFLWGSIVVSNLCQQLLAQRPLALLMQYVNDFPLKLEEYFRTLILERVQDSFLSENAIVLKLMTMDIHRDSRHPAFVISWILSQKGPEFFNDPMFHLRHESTYPSASAETTEDTVKAFISICCKDLLCLYRHSEGVCCVGFLHRTVLDFLNTRDTQMLISKHVPDHFNTRHITAQLEIVSIKMQYATRPALSSSDCCIVMWRINRVLNGRYRYAEPDEQIMLNEMETLPSEMVEEFGLLLLRLLKQRSPNRANGDLVDVQEDIGPLLMILVDRGFDSLAYELLKATKEGPDIAVRIVGLNDRPALPLLVVLGTDLRGAIALRDINIPLLRMMLETSGVCTIHNRHDRSSYEHAWQAFLRLLVFRSSGGAKYAQPRAVEAAPLMFPFDPDLHVDDPVHLREPYYREDEEHIQLDGPWKVGQIVPYMEILEAFLPSVDFEAIHKGCDTS